MLVTVLLFFAGLALVVVGADVLVDGASCAARRAGLSEFLIGLTIVGMGTSAPEMVVSVLGAIEGKGDVAVGNVVGSNIFNTLLILGLTAVLLPVSLTRGNRKRDIPANLLVALVFIVLGLVGIGGGNGISQIEGIIMLVIFVLYMWQSFVSGKNSPEAAEEEAASRKPLWLSVLMILGGLAGLTFGGSLFVDNATVIAGAMGVSDKFIAITILAGGTSLPELATCVAAAVKKKGQLALGNIIGSNIFNLLLIIGTSAVIRPLSFVDINLVDMGMLLLSALLLLPATVFRGKEKLGRVDGAVFIAVWLAYMVYLIITI